MKPRRVLLTLEVETDAPLSALYRVSAYVHPIVVADATGERYEMRVLQAQANVVRPAPKRKRR